MAALPLLWRYITNYKWWWLLGMLLSIGGSCFALVNPSLVGTAIDNLARPQADHNQLLPLALAVIGFALLEGIFRFGSRLVYTMASRKIEQDMRADLFRHMQAMDQAYYQTIHTGDLMSRATNDMNAVRNFTGMGIGNFFQTAFIFGLAMFLMFGLNTQLALIVLVVLPCVSIAFFVVGRRMRVRYEKVQAKYGDLSTHAQENFSGSRVIKAYVQEEAEIKKFADQNREYIKDNLAYVQLSGALWPLMFLIQGIATALVVWVGGMQVIEGKLTLGQLVQFTGYLALLGWPMIALGWVVNLFEQGMASMQRIREVLSTKPDVTSSAQPKKLEVVQGELEFDNVGLRYGEVWALRHISFRIPAGTTCAIVGPTGAGKTSLVNLLARVYDPQEGVIRLDGVDTRELELADLRRYLGYVPQDTFLFSLPLKENIAFGVEDYTLSQVQAAAETARLSKDLEQIPGGLEATIGERGVTLSGGQKQRTAIARAVTRDPAVLILDDALSSIDTQTQAEILSNLRGVLAGRTSLIISQRISTVKEADQIIVLDEGRIIERGDHRSLLAQNGLYASMYRRELLSQELDES
jgi:ATP-binding cassette subfamily B multidrug efflux pump